MFPCIHLPMNEKSRSSSWPSPPPLYTGYLCPSVKLSWTPKERRGAWGTVINIDSGNGRVAGTVLLPSSLIVESRTGVQSLYFLRPPPLLTGVQSLDFHRSELSIFPHGYQFSRPGEWKCSNSSPSPTQLPSIQTMVIRVDAMGERVEEPGREIATIMLGNKCWQIGRLIPRVSSQWRDRTLVRGEEW